MRVIIDNKLNDDIGRALAYVILMIDVMKKTLADKPIGKWSYRFSDGTVVVYHKNVNSQRYVVNR